MTHWGNGGIGPCILNLYIRWRWVVSFTPRPLHLRVKIPRYPLDKESEWALEPVCTRWQREEILSARLPGIEPRPSSPKSNHLLTERAQLKWTLNSIYRSRLYLCGSLKESVTVILLTRYWTVGFYKKKEFLDQASRLPAIHIYWKVSRVINVFESNVCTFHMW
jgi:hypothetical protein